MRSAVTLTQEIELCYDSNGLKRIGELSSLFDKFDYVFSRNWIPAFAGMTGGRQRHCGPASSAG